MNGEFIMQALYILFDHYVVESADAIFWNQFAARMEKEIREKCV